MTPCELKQYRHTPEGESMHAFGVDIPMAGRLKKFPWA